MAKQVACRAARVRNTDNYLCYIDSIKHLTDKNSKQLLKESELLLENAFCVKKRYDMEGDAVADSLYLTELYGFLDDASTPYHTLELDLTGISVSFLANDSGCYRSSIMSNAPLYEHLLSIELMDRSDNLSFDKLPIIGVHDCCLDSYMLKYFNDLSLDAGIEGVPVMKRTKREINRHIMNNITSIGLYACRYITDMLDGRSFVRSILPAKYIIRSERPLSGTFDLLLQGSLLHQATLYNRTQLLIDAKETA